MRRTSYVEPPGKFKNGIKAKFRETNKTSSTVENCFLNFNRTHILIKVLLPKIPLILAVRKVESRLG